MAPASSPSAFGHRGQPLALSKARWMMAKPLYYPLKLCGWHSLVGVLGALKRNRDELAVGYVPVYETLDDLHSVFGPDIPVGTLYVNDEDVEAFISLVKQGTA